MNAIAQVSAARLTGPKLDNRRVLAGIVDVLIVGVGAAVILAAGDALSGDRPGALSAVILGWALYYYFALESGGGQTVGKRLMKLRVARADGRPVEMRDIAVRTVLRVVDGIGLYIVGLIVMLVTGDKRQRIGDLAAGTIVVDAAGPATAVAEPALPDAATDDAADEDAEDTGAENESAEEPSAYAEPTQTITLPSRPEPPATIDDLTEPEAEEVAEEPVAEEVAEEPVAEEIAEQPVVEEPAVDAEPMDLDSVVPVPEADTGADADAEADGSEEPLPQVTSPSIEELATDVAAAQDEPAEQAADPSETDEPGDDEPVNVRSVETVSAMDLIMGAAEEDAAQSDDDEAPASA